MARKKDLAGLASLAGLAYLASRDKGGSSSTAAAGDDQYTPDVKQGPRADLAETAPAADEDYGNESRREGYGIGKAAPSAAPRPRAVAPKAPSNPNYGNEGRRPVREASAPTYETPYDRARREDREAGRDIGSVIESLKNRISTAGERGSALPLKSTKSDRNDFMGSGMKKGGSVKGWGIARGARKAKTY